MHKDCPKLASVGWILVCFSKLSEFGSPDGIYIPTLEKACQYCLLSPQNTTPPTYNPTLQRLAFRPIVVSLCFYTNVFPISQMLLPISCLRKTRAVLFKMKAWSRSYSRRLVTQNNSQRQFMLERKTLFGRGGRTSKIWSKCCWTASPIHRYKVIRVYGWTIDLLLKNRIPVTNCVTLPNKWDDLPIFQKSQVTDAWDSLLDVQSSRKKYSHSFWLPNIILISITRGDGLVFTFPGTDITTGRKTGYLICSVLFPARRDLNGNAKITRTTTDRNTWALISYASSSE